MQYSVRTLLYTGEHADLTQSLYNPLVKSGPFGWVHCHLSRDVRKPVFGVSDQVRNKPGCAATEDGWRLEISDLESRGIVLSKWRKQRRWSATRLSRSWSASLFSHMQKSGFLTSRLIYRGIRSIFSIFILFLMKIILANRIAPDGTKRIHHWCQVGTGKSQPEGPPFRSVGIGTVDPRAGISRFHCTPVIDSIFHIPNKT